MARLNVGSFRIEADWTNIDLFHGCDVRADLLNLPFPADTFKMALASHVLEHVPFDDAVRGLREVARTVHAGGEICVRGPDCAVVALPQAVDGNPSTPGMAHHWRCDALELERLCHEAGLTIVESRNEWPAERGWPLAEVELVGVA